MFDTQNYFGEDIGYLRICSYMRSNELVIKEFTGVFAIYFDMFCSLMIHRICNNLIGACVVCQSKPLGRPI